MLDPADSNSGSDVYNLRHAVSSKGVMLGHHDQLLRRIMDSLTNLTTGLARVESQLQSNNPPVYARAP